MIMRRVEQGESFTVTRNGTPVADLVPHDAVGRSRGPRFVPVDVVAAGLAALPAWGPAEFTQERRELDLALDDRDVDPWDNRR